MVINYCDALWVRWCLFGYAASRRPRQTRLTAVTVRVRRPRTPSRPSRRSLFTMHHHHHHPIQRRFTINRLSRPIFSSGGWAVVCHRLAAFSFALHFIEILQTFNRFAIISRRFTSNPPTRFPKMSLLTPTPCLVDKILSNGKKVLTKNQLFNHAIICNLGTTLLHTYYLPLIGSYGRILHGKKTITARYQPC